MLWVYPECPQGHLIKGWVPRVATLGVAVDLQEVGPIEGPSAEGTMFVPSLLGLRWDCLLLYP